MQKIWNDYLLCSIGSTNPWRKLESKTLARKRSTFKKISTSLLLVNQKWQLIKRRVCSRILALLDIGVRRIKGCILSYGQKSNSMVFNESNKTENAVHFYFTLSNKRGGMIINSSVFFLPTCSYSIPHVYWFCKKLQPNTTQSLQYKFFRHVCF